MHARPFWPHIGVLFFLSLLATPIALLKPYALKLLIDSGFGSQAPPSFISFLFPLQYHFTFATIAMISAVLVILVALIDNINIYISWILSTLTGEKLVLNFRTILFNHIQRLSLAYHDKKGSSDSLYRIQWDTMDIRNLLLIQIPGLVSAAITLIAMTGVMFIINWQFAAITLCIIPPLVILTKLSTNRLIKDWYKVKDAESVALSVIHEVLNSLRVVKAFGQEKNENDRFAKRSDEVVKGHISLARVAASYSFIVSMLLAIATAVILYTGATFVNSGKMTLGELTLVIAYITQIFGPLQSIIKNLNDVQSSVASIDRIYTVLEEQKEVIEDPEAIHLPRIKGGFEFQNICFSYGDNILNLDQISFAVNPGDRVGIMGSTGAGKSTLINLLNRFYDPTYGKILVDGDDIKKYKLADYRNQFAIVLQDPILFSSTIGENIRYGRPGASDEEVISAAKSANAHEFIVKSSHGYDTPVGERGMQLSGGERQRISLARAFIKNAPVLILDEPTSSLDVRTEALIMEAMERLMEGRTTFLITHRLDTLNSCNLIIHLELGKIVDIVRDSDKDIMANKKMVFFTGIE